MAGAGLGGALVGASTGAYASSSGSIVGTVLGFVVGILAGLGLARTKAWNDANHRELDRYLVGTYAPKSPLRDNHPAGGLGSESAERKDMP